MIIIGHTIKEVLISPMKPDDFVVLPSHKLLGVEVMKKKETTTGGREVI